MSDRQRAVLDRLDAAVAMAALLPVDERLGVLDVAVSRLQAGQATDHPTPAEDLRRDRTGAQDQ